jgi:CRISPR-associated protein Cmr2
MTHDTIYTAVSFAPVQGFIEKSRKLRDLYGASLILSYLSQKIVEKAEEHLGKGSVISPGLIDHQEGMPNRILIKGELTREIIQKTLLGEWQRILKICREWVEDNIGIPKEEYHWSQKLEQIGQEKGEWERWGSYTWEIFIGWGRPDPNKLDKNKNLIKVAMDDLETRKLKRDWIAVNWVGESSSLSGTDAIAWHQLGKIRDPQYPLTKNEKEELTKFYRQLAWVLDEPYKRAKQLAPADTEIQGKYIAANERLSVPELAKRLVTLPKLAKQIGMKELEPGFKDIYREFGYFTGWFMGDGDQVGDKLKKLAERNSDNPKQQEQELLKFSELMRGWGQEFAGNQNLFSDGKCRIIYAGGDDFMGVLYSEESQTNIKPTKLKPVEVWNWLVNLPRQWEKLQTTLAEELGFKDENRFTYSVGFVWAGHQVPQRDILQHCREAEKRAKSLGRDRVTIRVLFNSGQYVQWTCPWDYLDILTKYRDRNGINTQEEMEKGSQKRANWNHIYNDWATLKARHAIRLQVKGEDSVNKEVAIEIFDFYFDKSATRFDSDRIWDDLIGDVSGSNERNLAIMTWMDDLIQVGWQLCRNFNL